MFSLLCDSNRNYTVNFLIFKNYFNDYSRPKTTYADATGRFVLLWMRMYRRSSAVIPLVAEMNTKDFILLVVNG